jgi:hypothetical protein
MVSSLALDAATSCAAARAGIRRAQEVSDFELISEEGDEVLPTGHAAANELTAGFEGKGRLVQLMAGALEDVARETWPESGAPPADATLYLSLPDPGRIFSDLDVIASEPQRKARQERAAEATKTTVQALARDLMGLVAPLVSWPPLTIAHAGSSGRPGFAEALAAATRDLSTRPPLSTAIVGGVDSQLDTETMTWLYETGRLKFSQNPVGVEPGEAAAFVVLQNTDKQRSPSKVLAWLAAAHVESGSSPEPGAALTKAVIAAQAAAALPRVDWLVNDNDGTFDRAEDLGHTLVRLTNHGATANPHVTYPAITFGDVGAATGAVASCLAIAAWKRRWAPAPAAFLLGSSRQQRAVHVLLAPDR